MGDFILLFLCLFILFICMCMKKRYEDDEPYARESIFSVYVVQHFIWMLHSKK